MHNDWIKLHLKSENDLYVVNYESAKVMASASLRNVFNVD
jgi:hypothetical protein